MRDDFTPKTIDVIAKRAGFLCSNPECKSPTVGSAPGHDKSVNIGVAAHITAAAPGGPRYDPSLTPEQRRDQSNGIWLCQTHGKLVDSDSVHFTVEMLREWKGAAETQSFRAIIALQTARNQLSESRDLCSILERIAASTNSDANIQMLRDSLQAGGRLFWRVASKL